MQQRQIICQRSCEELIVEWQTHQTSVVSTVNTKIWCMCGPEVGFPIYHQRRSLLKNLMEQRHLP